MKAGKNLLHYRLVEQIGEGGMGVVWKALDTTLDREVAIKVLPAAFAEDDERVARFEREAKLLASLNHPNIATIHGFHKAEGAYFLTMELVEGQDLAQRLAAGPMPMEPALRIALQVAEGLQAAHDSGVIHRDLKPANVRLTADGKAKVLDLGLAKAFELDAASGGSVSSLELSPTVTSAKTMAGMLLGTAAYMSPEQARGEPADRRSDVWAFGCLLYEMLSAKQMFAGRTVSDTLASVLKVEPEWNVLPDGTPRPIHRLLRRCLAKEPERRLHHIADARLDIQEALERPAEQADAAATELIAPAAPLGQRVLPWAILLLLAIVAAAAWLGGGRGSSIDVPLMNLAVPLPEGFRIPADQLGVLALSPDGRALAIAGRAGDGRGLYLKTMDEPALRLLEDTAGASTPVFSPDGRWIAFFADTKLKKVSVDGGKPVTLCSISGTNRGASWGGDDRIVFSPHYTRPLLQVSGAGGDPLPLTTLDAEKNERTHRWPQFVPGHDVVLFTVGTTESPEFYDDARIDALNVKTGERRTVFEGASMARYAPTGHLILGRGGFLFAVQFDIGRLEVTGSPVPVVEEVMGLRNSGVVHAELSQNGLLAYLSGEPMSRRRALTWRYRDGRTETLPAPVRGYINPALSPDETQIAVAIEGESNFDIWTYDIARETLTRLTFEGDNTLPVWSPDGKTLAFSSIRAGRPGSIYLKAADGSGASELLVEPDTGNGEGLVLPTSWATDGLVAVNVADANAGNVGVLDLKQENRHIERFLSEPHAEFHAVFSPDRRWIAYNSGEAGPVEVYVRPYPGPGGRWQVSSDGGLEPQWTSDGKEIFFRQDSNLMRVEIDTGGGFKVGRPSVLLEGGFGTTNERAYSVSADGRRVLLAAPTEAERTTDEITVIVNWFDDLTTRVPD